MDSSQSSVALFGSALLHLAPGLLFWPVVGFQHGFVDYYLVVGALFFVLLGIWAQWMPLLPSAIGLASYLPFGVMLVAAKPSPFQLGIVIGTFALLATAVVTSFIPPKKNSPETPQA